MKQKCLDCGKELKYKNVTSKCKKCYNMADVPTPEEIAERAAEIRAENDAILAAKNPRKNAGFPPEDDPFDFLTGPDYE